MLRLKSTARTTIIKAYQEPQKPRTSNLDAITPLRVHVPGEIIDRTLDYLHSEHQDLRAFALVCREWLPTCRYHLFHNVALESETTCVRLLAILQAAPYIAHYVRELTINSLYVNFIMSGPGCAFLAVVGHLTRVETLAAHNLGRFIDAFPTFPFRYFPRLRRLAVHSWYNAHPSQIAALMQDVARCDTLEDLTFRFVDYARVPPLHALGLATPRLWCLEAGSEELEMLVHSFAALSVERVRFAELRDEDALRNASVLLDRAGASVQSLTLGLRSAASVIWFVARSPEDVVPGFLRNNTCISSLSIRCNLNAMRYTNFVIARLPSPLLLRHLALHLDLQCEADMEYFPWRAFVHSLSPCTNLHMLHITLSIRLDRDLGSISEMIKQKLPGLPIQVLPGASRLRC